MKRIFPIILGLFIIAGVVGGTVAWAEASKNWATKASATVDASYSGKQIEVAVGKTFIVTLDSNITTGFSWQLVGNTDEAVVELVDSEYQTSEAAQELVGAGGKELWTFKALEAGNCTISMEYSRPWEQGVPPVDTFVVTVIVKPRFLNTGVLEGTVTIGPICPVQRPDKPCPVPCEAYQARKVIVYDKSGANLVKEIDIDCEGHYRTELQVGEYMVDTSHIGIDRSSGVPTKIRIEPGETVVVNIDIDTGIR